MYPNVSSPPNPPGFQMNQMNYPSPMAYGQPLNPGYDQSGYPVPIMQAPSSVSSNFYPGPLVPQPQPAPYVNSSVPRGLEVLLPLNQLIIEQQVEMLEAFIGYETNNKYVVKNINGQHLYYAAEENNLFVRNCLGEARPFVMRIYDNQRNEIIRLDRPLRCNSCFFPCCLQNLDVYGNGQKLGSIVQEWSLFFPNFSVLNAVGEKVLHIQGPLMTFSCGAHVEFTILSIDRDVEVGKISKQWSGLAREFFTDADRFGVEFPNDLDVNIKAVLLGATLLIDFMYFEHVGK